MAFKKTAATAKSAPAAREATAQPKKEYPRVSAIYRSNFLRASDLPPEGQNFEITDANEERLGAERQQKIVLTFQGGLGRWPLNKSQSTVLQHELGDSGRGWITAVIKLTPRKIFVDGQVLVTADLTVIQRPVDVVPPDPSEPDAAEW